MKKKRFSMVTAIFTLIMQIISIIQPVRGLAATGKDVTNTFDFITGISLTDNNGNALGANVAKDAEVRINYTWSIPNRIDGQDLDVNSGDYYRLQLPQEIKIYSAINSNINDTSGNRVATMNINTSGLVTITFTDYPSTHSNVVGNFYASSRFDSTKIGTNNPIPIEFTIPGIEEPTIVKVDFAQANPSIQKDIDGGYSAATDEITWKITINKENVNVDSASIEDTIQVGQNFVPGSVKVDGILDNSSNHSYDSDNKKFVYNFGDITTQKVITFKTSIHDDLAAKGQDTYTYSNNATLKYTEKGSPKSVTSSTKSVSVPVKLISKSGSYDSENKRINWTITVNESGRTINNAVVSDPIPDGLTLDQSTVKVDGVNGSNYTISGQNFTYNLGNITSQKVITFSTNVDSAVYNSNTSPTYTNKATLTGDGVASGTSANIGVGVPTNIIRKEGDGYDASTGIITWKITVNSNLTNVGAGAVVTDTIPSGQTYVEGSTSIDDTTNGSFTTLESGQVVYTFNNGFNKTYVITLKTQVTDVNKFRANYTGSFSNDAKVVAPSINQTTTGTQSITSNVITKSGTNYNYLTRELTWKIEVNNNKMPITNVVVTDAIPAGQQYVSGSASIDDSTKGAFDSDSNISSTGLLKYTFNSQINKKYTITFKTKIIDLSIFNTNGNKTVYNTASITGSEIPTTGVANSQGNRAINNSVVNKASAYAYGNSYIDWTVKTNSNWNIDLSNATITDSLPIGLELDTDTVELYKAIVSSTDGSLTQGNSIELTGDNVKYDPVTRKFEFTFPADAGTNAYILKFRTNTTRTGDFSNTVEFKGSGVQQSSTNSRTGVWFSVGGGSATGDTASIKLIKYNDDGSKKLSGAVFQLIDKYGNVKATSAATGSDGAVTFSKLKYDRDYSIKEITAPTGYKLNSSVYTFQIKTGLNQGTTYDSSDGVLKYSSSDNTNKIVTYNYRDSIFKGSIEFYKNGVDGVLQGSVFTLYTEDGNTVVKDSSGNNITATSESDGKVLFTNIPYGKYKIKETSAPTSYSIYKADITADLTTISGDGQSVHASPYLVFNTKIKGSVKITKTDEETGAKIQGASVAIFDNNKEQIRNAKSTDANGQVQFDNLEYGNYFYQEISSPDNYVLDNTYHSFKIEADSTSSNPQALSFTNRKVKGNISFTKVGEGSDSSKLQGAVFGLYQNDGVTEVRNSSNQPVRVTSGNDGKVVFNNIEYGNYKIKEITPPVGYNLNTEVLEATIGKNDNGQTVSPKIDGKTVSTVKNIKIRGNIEFIKVGEDSDAQALQGAVFGLYQQDGLTPVTNLLGDITSTSDIDGKVRFSGVEYGSYKIKEILSPTGYNVSNQVLNATIQVQGNTVTPKDSISENDVSVFNNSKVKSTIKIIKHGADGTTPLSGAEFTLYNDDTNQVIEKKTTDASGVILFGNLKYGKYRVQETKAPQGYVLSQIIIKREIGSTSDNNQTYTYDVTNVKITGSVSLQKNDEKGNSIKGAEFTLYDKSDTLYLNPLAVVLSDDNGVIKFLNVVYGDYVVVETKTSDNSFVLSTTPLNAAIGDNDDGKNIELGPVVNVKKKGTIKIKKTDLGENPLKGAEFTLYDSNENEVETVISDNNGLVTFNNAIYGQYSVKETKAPTGYNINNEEKSVNVTEDGKVYDLGNIVDSKITGGIEISKTDISTSAPVSGATLTIYTKNGDKVVEGVTGQDGKIQFNSLEYGDYYFEETKAPEGYLLNTDKHSFSIREEGAILKGSLTNTMITGGIKISKTDFSTKEAVPGATLTIYNRKGGKVVEGITGQDGTIEFDKLNYGEYYFEETKAPEGYLLNPDKHEFSIKEDGVILTDSLTNTMITGGVEITKTDSVTGNPIKGASIALFTKAGHSVGDEFQSVTDEEGKVKFENLLYGDYYFIETSAPEGYLLNTDKHEFSIKEDGVVVKEALTNTMITGSIKISKTDVSTSEPVPGATLTIYTKDGKKVVEGLTEEDGTIQFNKLNYGDYYFVETKAPEGYLLNPDKHSFSIKEDGIILTDSLTNTMITGGIKISKTDVSTSEPVPGATLTIYTKDGKKVVEGLTEEDGTIQFNKLNYGDYYFVETKAPEGYLLNPDKHSFSIKEDGVILQDSLTNTLITGGIKISKTDFSTGSPVPGATLTIYTSDNKKVVEGVTGKDGTIQFDKLNYGDYYFIETKAPVGYLLNPNKHPFSIKKDGVIVKDSLTDIANFQITMDAEPNSIVGDGKSTTVITAKVVDENNKPLAGIKVEFSAEKGDFPKGSSAVTDENGVASVVYRSSKIEGIENQVIPVNVYIHDEEHGLNAQDKINITFMPGIIQGVVVDNDTGLPIKGAIVEIKQDFDGDGVIDFTAKVITSDDGKYKIVVPKGDVTYNLFITKPVEINGKMENKTFTQKSHAGTMTGSGEDVFDSVKTAAGVILVKNVDGTKGYLNDYSKYSIEFPGNSTDIKIGNDGNSKGIFEIPNLEKGHEYNLNIVYHFEDGTKIVVGKINLTLDSNGEMIISTALIDPYGIITDATTGKVIEGADVRLYYADTKRNVDAGKKPGTLVELPELENFPPANNKNPQFSDKGGNYAFMVFPNTDYYIVVTKPGYDTFTSGTIEVNDEIVKLDIQMTPAKSTQVIDKVDDSKLPQTGSLVGLTGLVMMGLMSIVSGLMMIFTKRRRYISKH
ncbi:SpaA isopeptide-forming pilin-related protein [Clostridium intestinale]|uniref:SpaA isopeptide-forming pilin-related protein n=1 Tax=Clostridium intestinale TaxID=36845 RepID=UPI0028E18768|nr:SpaA isopeptide-forming pilin-related protein [Clostridium intestinale]